MSNIRRWRHWLAHYFGMQRMETLRSWSPSEERYVTIRRCEVCKEEEGAW